MIAHTDQAEQFPTIEIPEKRYHCVGVERKFNDGGSFIQPISPFFETREEAQAFFDSCNIEGKRFGVYVEFLYPSDTPENQQP
jgi:hypothetical protein